MARNRQVANDMALDKLALFAISDTDVLDILRTWEFQSYDCCFVPPLLTTFEPQHPPKRSPGTCLCTLLKKHSPGTVRHHGTCNQCCWARRCYNFYSPSTSCLRSVCTLARGQHAAHVCTAVSIYHHHHDSRAPPALSIFLVSNHECLM